MALYLGKADRTRKKWMVRGTLSSGRKIKFPAHRDHYVALQVLRFVEQLDRAAYINDLPPDKAVAWANKLSTRDAEKLVQYGLLEQRYLEQRLPINDLLNKYEEHLASGRNCAGYVKQSIWRIRKIFTRLNIKTFKDVTLEKVRLNVNQLVKTSNLSSKTHYHYVGSLKEFCNWMVATERSAVNPLAKLDKPSPYADPVINRRPLSREDFAKLISFLGTLERYPHQQAAWTGRVRALLYRTAVYTGFRLSELCSLTPAHLRFEQSGAEISIRARDAKNRTAWSIPIPDELAVDLREHAKGLAPDDRLFVVPSCHRMRIRTFRRDLDEAGVQRQFDNGDRVDFHALRSTAICWWCQSGRHRLLDVQFMARLKSLPLVEKYVRKFVPDHRKLLGGEDTGKAA